jgi:hypothetical protein
MIHLRRSGPVLTASPGEVRSTREAFARAHHLVLPGFLDAGVLDVVTGGLAATTFVEMVHHGIGRELCAEDGAAFSLLLFLANDPRLFEMVRALTGIEGPPFGCFVGRVYRFLPGSEHYDSWHNDAIQTRAMALAVNLGGEPHEGGVLEIREEGSEEILAAVPNTELGSAVLLRIDARLVHRVTPVTGRAPRTTFAGWFQEKPHFRDLLAPRPVTSR